MSELRSKLNVTKTHHQRQLNHTENFSIRPSKDGSGTIQSRVPVLSSNDESYFTKLIECKGCAMIIRNHSHALMLSPTENNLFHAIKIFEQ